MLTGLREWDRRMKVPENYLEWMPEAYEPVNSPAYQWFVRFKYMPIVSQLEDEGTKCWYDIEFTFVENEVRYMFDTALRKVSEVGSYTCALVWQWRGSRRGGIERDVYGALTVCEGG